MSNVLICVLIALVVILLLQPFFLLRILKFVCRITFFRIRVDGVGEIPASGPALLVANHVAFFDSLMILAATWRRVHFMMHEDFFRPWPLRLILRYLGVVRVPSMRNKQEVGKFLEEVRALLRAGNVVCVYPEGGVSDNGLLREFHSGIRTMLPEDRVVPVIPIRLGMLWGRLFAPFNGKLKFLPPRRLPIIVSITIGKPVSPDLKGFQLRQIISEMGADSEMKAFPGELPLHSEFLRRSKRHPFRCTFKDFGSADLSNFAMLVRGLIFSRKIRELDKNPAGGYVGILLPNCTAQIAAILGVMYADRSPAILNYTAGTAALQQAIEKSKTKLVLTSRKFLDKIKLDELPEMVFLEDVVPTVTPWEKRKTILQALLLPWRLLLRLYSPDSRYDLYRPAVLLFSSGSTGKPKGVALTHRNINCDIFAFWRVINWNADDKVIGSLPLFHAFGFTVCFAFPALSGTKSVFLMNILDAAQALKLIEEEKITLMITTPTFLQNYMRRVKDGQLKSLRLVITGAEKLRSDIIRDFSKLTSMQIVEGYGCTELSPIVSVNLASSFLTLGKLAGKRDSIGASMPGIHVKIVDPETGVELPPYHSGMLMVKGGNVMNGYLDDLANTAEVIRDGFYRTGDIASMSPDGYITITGRLSRFSKIGGEMVPHELVERTIAEYLESEGRSVAVTGKPDPKRGEKLIVFHTVENLDPEKLIEGLREKELPNLWIPKPENFIKLDSLPLLGSGKLDLQSLKKRVEELP